MFFVPAPATVPDGIRRRPARCFPSMIRAPPSRPVPAAVSTRVCPPPVPTSISRETSSIDVPQTASSSAAVAVAAAAAAAGSVNISAPATATTTTDVANPEDPTDSFDSSSRPNNNPHLSSNSRTSAAHLKRIENARPDGAHLASAAMITSPETTNPSRRELYYGAPPTTSVRNVIATKPTPVDSSTSSRHRSSLTNASSIAAPPGTREGVELGKSHDVLHAVDIPDSPTDLIAESTKIASKPISLNVASPASPMRTRTRSRTRSRNQNLVRRGQRASSRSLRKGNISEEDESDFEPLDGDDDDEPKAARRGRKGRKVPSGDDSVRSYLTEIGEVKLLDADTEVDLARQIAKLLQLERLSAKMKEASGIDPSIEDWAAASGMDIHAFRKTLRCGLRAKEHMVAANLRLVVSIAKKYVNRGLTFQDLIQEGSIGLIRGAEKFDGDKGFKFSTYATWWIRQAITRAIADHSRPIRLPVHVNDTISSISKTTKALEDELGRPPVEQELAARLQISVEKLRFIMKSSRATISLETPIAKDGKSSSATLGSFIVWDGDTPEETAVKTLLREDLENVLNTLTSRERDVVRMRYGFDDGRMKTLEEIGATFDVTRERIRQIEAKALRKLRHPNRNAVLREYVYEEL